jgi:hypothetical protein
MSDGYRHSMCRECWRKKRGGKSVGFETPMNRRIFEVCCFCGSRHKSGIHVPKNPNSREVRCGNAHDLKSGVAV